MKKYSLIFLVILLFQGTFLSAQSPEGIHYQAIAWDNGNPIVNSPINVRFSILVDTAMSYQEEHTIFTNQYGLFVAIIGEGTVVGGSFNSIPWGFPNTDIELRTELDIGSGYVLMGEEAFKSVPYAHYAERIGSIMGSPIDQQNPNAGDVLRFNGSSWQAVPDSSTVYSAGTGILISGTTIINAGDTNPADDIVIGTPASGDLSGAYPSPTVEAIQGQPISNANPASGQVWKWNGSQWEPGTDSVNTYLPGVGINITGTTITNTGDVDPFNDITNTTPAGGDLSGIYPNPTVTGIQGFSFSNQTPSVGEVWKWDGSQWTPAPDLVATGGGAVNTTARLLGDGTPGQPLDIAQQNASTDQILKWDGSNWRPANDSINNYTAGTGISISGLNITNTGDIDPSDDITSSTFAGGDLDGTYPNPSVVRLRGNMIASQSPLPNQVLKFNGLQWVPMSDQTVDSDSDPLNEIQTLSIVGDSLFLSNGGAVELPSNVWLPDGTNTYALQETGIDARVRAGINGNDRGFVYVYDENNALRAGLHVTTGGMGEAFADIKNFRVAHPTRPDKEIWYASLEGPEAGAYVRGTATLRDGTAIIDFPEHFELISDPESMTVILTPLSADSKGLAVIEKSQKGFKVKELFNGKGQYEIDWEVKCVRKGHEDFQVIRDRM